MKKCIAVVLIFCLALTFCPALAQGTPVTRQEAVCAIVQMIGLNSYPQGADLSAFEDAHLVTAAAQKQVAAAVAANLYPVEGGCLSPDSPATGALVNGLLSVNDSLQSLAVFGDTDTLDADMLNTLVNEIDAALTTVTPQENFYLWANRVTLRNYTPLEDEAWTLYHQLQADAYAQEQEQLLKVCAQSPDAFEPGTAAHRLSWLNMLINDNDTRNSAGIAPLLPYFTQIDACQTAAELFALLPEIEKATGVTMFFSIMADLDDETGRLLPTINYYPFGPLFYGEVEDTIADGYRQLALQLYQAAGLAEQDGKAYDQLYALALKSLDAPLWDETTEDSTLQVLPAQVDEKLSTFSMTAYLTALGIDPAQPVVIDNSLSFASFANALTDETLPAFQLFVKHRLLTDTGIYLDDTTALLAQSLGDYLMYGFSGSAEPFVPSTVLPYSNLSGEALYKYLHSVEGNQDVMQLFVDTCVPQEAIAAATEITEELRQAFAERIRQADWMSQATKEKALTKLEQITACLVTYTYQRHITEGATLCECMMGLKASTLSMTVTALSGHESYAKILRDNPDIVNACYVPEKNAIDVPGALFRWPFYIEGNRAATLGCLGAVIGHELTHGFDPDGSQYDGEGLKNNWWTEEDSAAFAQRVDRLIAYYNTFPYRAGMTQDASQTRGEAIADIGGLHLVMDILQGDTDAQRAALTQFAQLWAMAATDEQMDDLAQSDVHPVKTIRVNAAVAALDEFYACFNVQEGDSMYVAPENRPHVW